MLTAFLTAKGLLGIKNQWWIAAVSVLVAGAFVLVEIADNSQKRRDDMAVDKGRAEATAEGQAVTLEQVGAANEAGNEIERGGDAAVDGCVSGARGDATGCERFR